MEGKNTCLRHTKGGSEVEMPGRLNCVCTSWNGSSGPPTPAFSPYKVYFVLTSSLLFPHCISEHRETNNSPQESWRPCKACSSDAGLVTQTHLGSQTLWCFFRLFSIYAPRTGHNPLHFTISWLFQPCVSERGGGVDCPNATQMLQESNSRMYVHVGDQVPDKF